MRFVVHISVFQRVCVCVYLCVCVFIAPKLLSDATRYLSCRTTQLPITPSDPPAGLFHTGPIFMLLFLRF